MLYPTNEHALMERRYTTDKSDRMKRSALLLFVFAATSYGFAISVNVIVTPARCGLLNGTAGAQIINGAPPHTFVWSTGATTQVIGGLDVGTYSVTVTDALGNTAQGSGNIIAIPALGIAESIRSRQQDCDQTCIGQVEVVEGYLGGAEPYIYNIQPTPFPGYLGYEFVCGGTSNLLTIADQNGCTGEVDLGVVVGNVVNSGIVVSDITPSCAGDPNGTFTVTLLGGDGQSYVHVWRQSDNSEYSYYPAIGEPYVVTDLLPGTYSASSWVDGMDGYPICTHPWGSIEVPEIPGPCGTVSGTVFNDADQDCIQDPGDPGLPYRVLTTMPGPRYGFTDVAGQYSIGVQFGSHTLAQPMVDEAQLCPTAVPVPFTVNGSTPALTIELADSSYVPFDLEMHIANSSMRPGFSYSLDAFVRNNTAYPSDMATIDMSYDPQLAPVQASAGGSVGAGSVTWTVPSIPAYGGSVFRLTGTLVADVNLIGTVFTFTATVSSGTPEGNLSNNIRTKGVTVTGSYDPNDKHGETDGGQSDAFYFLNEDSHIDYTVRFQNTGTAAAEFVVIRDLIDTDFDITSLEILGASHAFTPSFAEGRELVFTFNDIQLPDSTTDLLGSQGFISYRIKPRTGIIIGDVFENTANIYFDFNPAIVTNTTEHVVEMSTTVGGHSNEEQDVEVFPNPASDLLVVQLKDGTTKIIGVFDINGSRCAVPINARSTGYLIDIESLQAGMYVVLTTKGAARFVKQ
ncbi:MAG TPA: T9SS type A sorting domain-containing protein [Flavobacteriales bacterium]|mgnify:CR=1 FL=1|jgi:uncharacterized repeat protein (TIGR01451 family)|nr:T9SS type A sorting domain-containing protein [Flavobacteriales bacterium]MBP9177952.1 T9SS type A sorting domain-containing protein [Flavobacteriales bacterium]MCC6910971.1 T9SS type A sorting domain-containing protein [Flavobacteriales bacterium]HQX98998.1 T9SS type A sorting domain-containing protein [Flavobacteriales bacterium]